MICASSSGVSGVLWKVKIEDRVKERQILMKIVWLYKSARKKGDQKKWKLWWKKSDEKKGNVSAEKKKVFAEEEEKCCQGKVKVAHLLQ